ncbi:hypothetical protein NFHSH190041_36320 [Shewanella sp. NFH-SH190041]|uniref:hypothetical protein n=1 Tax=Shewanella sp. NFH-SH190041 TaxID=2950245 RepID=UPI0021C2F268|nr:hypothetical protein [Shewanella sp. NFH-SH190041]BDM66180.1 hypothetical protein NFHSH190041_36320 [Shewanella sp. NFH-SH190041]
MRQLITLGLLLAAGYYLYLETDLLTASSDKAAQLQTEIRQTVAAFTGTDIIRTHTKPMPDKHRFTVRMSKPEQTELDIIFTSPETLNNFVDTICQSANPTHPVFSRDNTRYLCDQLN